MSAVVWWFFLWLTLGRSEAENSYLGMTMTFYPKDAETNTSYTTEMRYKITLSECQKFLHSYICFSGDCGEQSWVSYTFVDEGSTVEGPICQTEVVRGLKTPTNAPFRMWMTEEGFFFGDSVSGAKVSMSAFTEVDLRERSDTGRANRPPQATIMSPIRVASNCRREIRPLTFDPDGDRVVCRYGNAPYECNYCKPPPELLFTQDCVFTFKPTDGGGQGRSKVELMMEDFPQNDIVLTQSDGSQQPKSRGEHISAVPFQFTLEVSPSLPSCVDGLFLPRFIDPTPKHGAQIHVSVSERTRIDTIQAEAARANVSGLLFSGPSGVEKETLGTGAFSLSWEPSAAADGRTYPLCFVAQTLINSAEYHSEVRCVLLMVDTASPTSPTADTTEVFSTTATSSNNSNNATTTELTTAQNATTATTTDFLTTAPTNTTANTFTSTITTASVTNLTSDISVSVPQSTSTTLYTTMSDTPTSATSLSTTSSPSLSTTTSNTAAQSTTATLNEMPNPPTNATANNTSDTPTTSTNTTPPFANTTDILSTTPKKTSATSAVIPNTPTHATSLTTNITNTTVNTTTILPVTNLTSDIAASVSPSTSSTSNVSVPLTSTPNNSTSLTATTSSTSPITTPASPMTTPLDLSTTPNAAAQSTSPSNRSTTSIPEHSASPAAPMAMTAFLRARVSSSGAVSEDDMEAALVQVREELLLRGLSSNFTLRLSSITSAQNDTATAPPAAPT